MFKVPGPLTEETESKKAEKKKAQKAARKQREKEQKEEKLKKQQEEEEKRRFIALSDREKVTASFLPLTVVLMRMTDCVIFLSHSERWLQRGDWPPLE